MSQIDLNNTFELKWFFQEKAKELKSTLKSLYIVSDGILHKSPKRDILQDSNGLICSSKPLLIILQEILHYLGYKRVYCSDLN